MDARQFEEVVSFVFPEIDHALRQLCKDVIEIGCGYYWFLTKMERDSMCVYVRMYFEFLGIDSSDQLHMWWFG